MKETILTKDTMANQETQETCRSCHGETKHLIISDVSLAGEEWRSTYEIIRCRGCESISFREHYAESDGESIINENGVEEEMYNLIDFSVYPNPIKNYEKLEISCIPKNLARIYSETIDALNSNFTILAGIGIRSILEQICKDQDKDLDKDQDKKYLYKRLKLLRNKKLITPKDFDMIEPLIFFGNDAAHDAKQPSYEVLKTSIKIINNLLERLYMLNISHV